MLEKDFGYAMRSCARALAWLYFESGRISEIAECIEQCWKQLNRNDRTVKCVPRDKGWDRIEEVRKFHPALNLSMRRRSVLWFRFGFLLQRRGVDLGDRFLNRYARWRRWSSTQFGGTTIRWNALDLLGDGTKKVCEYPLDYFLHASELKLDVFEDIQIVFLDDCEESAALTSNGRKKTTADHVGTNARRMIEQRIKEAVRGAKIRGLTSAKDKKGRNVCHLTRDELARKLQSKFPSLRQFGVSTIVRAVGDFAACSMPWP